MLSAARRRGVDLHVAGERVGVPLGGVELLPVADLLQRVLLPRAHRDQGPSPYQLVRQHVLGPNNLLAAVSPPMVRSGSGRVVGIASVAGYRGLAGAEAYGATKAAQMQLLKGLRAVADGLERRRTEIVFPLPMAATMKARPAGAGGAVGGAHVPDGQPGAAMTAVLGPEPASRG